MQCSGIETFPSNEYILTSDLNKRSLTYYASSLESIIHSLEQDKRHLLEPGRRQIAEIQVR